jgi:lipoyl(octanoyl) transferase
MDLRAHRKDVRWFSTSLLTCLVRALDAFGIEAYVREGLETGVWVDDDLGPAKIGALGVRVERWVTYHGVALNVDPDLADFDLIVPCGLAGTRTTSMAQLRSEPVSVAEARDAFLHSFGSVFGVRLERARLGAPL